MAISEVAEAITPFANLDIMEFYDVARQPRTNVFDLLKCYIVCFPGNDKCTQCKKERYDPYY